MSIKLVKATDIAEHNVVLSAMRDAYQIGSGTQDNALRPINGVQYASPYPVMMLLNGRTDAAPTSVTGATYAVDYGLPWIPGGKGHAFSTAGAATLSAYFDLKTGTTPITPPAGTGVQAINLAVWVDDPAKLSGLTLYLDTTNGGLTWFRPATIANLRRGWNVVRLMASAGVVTTWNVFYRARLVAVATAATKIVIGAVWGECPSKARVIIVADGSYKGWLQNLYPTEVKDGNGVALPSPYQALKARGMPTTWGHNPARILAGEASVITPADLDTLRYDSSSAHSYHSWSSGFAEPFKTTANMTAEEYREDNARCIRWLNKEGLCDPRYIVRAAVHQNTAPNWQLAKGMIVGMATPTSGSAPTVFPWPDPYNIARIAIHARSNSYFDDLFSQLQQTRGVAVMYSHKLVPNGYPAVDVEQSVWEYFLSKLDAGLAAGWLEGSTFERLYYGLNNTDLQRSIDVSAIDAVRRAGGS